jgi:hypothetical protein
MAIIVMLITIIEVLAVMALAIAGGIVIAALLEYVAD